METQIPEWPPWLPGGWPHNLVHAVGWDGIRVASVAQERTHPWLGKSLQTLADEQDTTPYALLVDLMLHHEGSVGQWVDEISGYDSSSADPNLLSIMNHPAAAIVTDAEDYGGGSPHPAHAGAMARVLRWNRETQSLPWGVFLRKMTSLPAHRVGLDTRGRLKVGYPADLVVLDLESVGDHATWDEPRVASTGVDWVLINGKPVVEEGLFVGGNHGQVLRKPMTEAQP